VDLAAMPSFWDTGVNVLPSRAAVPSTAFGFNIVVFPRVGANVGYVGCSKAPRHFLILDVHISFWRETSVHLIDDTLASF
jgi:hypothetical protein